MVAANAAPPVTTHLLHPVPRSGMGLHVIVLNETHLIRAVDSFLSYYHEARCHQSLGLDSPNGRTPDIPRNGPIIAEPMVGGLHHRYRRAA